MKPMKDNKRNRRGLVSDALLICGVVSLTVGAAILSLAAGFIVAGCSCIAIGWLASMTGGDP